MSIYKVLGVCLVIICLIYIGYIIKFNYLNEKTIDISINEPDNPSNNITPPYTPPANTIPLANPVPLASPVLNINTSNIIFGSVGCAAYSKDLNIAIFINTSSSPYKVSTNVIDFISKGTPLNEVGVINGPSVNNYLFKDVVWSYRKQEFLFVADSIKTSYKSSDGITWKGYTSNNSFVSSLVSADKLGVYVVKKSSGTNDNYLLFSTDGITWTTTTYGNVYSSTIAYDDDLGILIYTNSMQSPDALSILRYEYGANELRKYKLIFNDNKSSFIDNCTIAKYNNKTYLYCLDKKNPQGIFKVDLTDFPYINDKIVNTNLTSPAIISWINSAKIMVYVEKGKITLDNNTSKKSITEFTSIEAIKDIGLNGVFVPNFGLYSAFIKFN